MTTRKSKKASEVKGKMLDLFFPPRCAICDEILSLEISEEHICKSCRKTLTYIKEPTCFKCGKEVRLEEEEYCSDCSRKVRSFIKGYPVFKYIPPISDSLMAFKYSGKKEYAGFYAREIYERYGNLFHKLGIEVLIPVPIFKKKGTTRGYNQAELIAKELGKLLDIPVRSDIIDRVSDTVAQKDLNPEERDRNLKKAFAPMKHVDIKSALIVDDIYTTGATIESCALSCHNAGIRDVYYTSVAIGEGN